MKALKKWFCASLIVCLLIVASGCADSADTPSAEEDTGTETAESGGESGEAPASEGSSEELLRLDFFAEGANYQGIQSGWYGNIIKEKFNIELNIIAPNVTGGGDALYQTRSAAGNIGDLIDLPYDQMRSAVQAGLVLDVSSYMENTTYLKEYLDAAKAFSEDWGVDGIYAFPTNASLDSPLVPAQIKANAPEYGAYLRWDYYYELGAPKIKDLDQMLDVLKQMQDNHPLTDSGKKTYAFSLFPDWDGIGMKTVNEIVKVLGYPVGNERAFVVSTLDGQQYELLDNEGPYYRGLKMYFQANQMGMVDPDSPSQNFDNVNAKVADGNVLYTWFPMTDYNTPENLAQGKGQIFVPVEEMKVGNLGHSVYGQGGVLAIGSNVKDPERVVKFLDWMASPENAMLVHAGPEGLVWEEVDGKPVLTEFGLSSAMGEMANTPVPAEWGGGTFRDGSARYEAFIPYSMATHPEYDEPYEPTMWSSSLKNSRTLVNEQWTEVFGYDWPLEYVQANDQLAVLPGNPWRAPADSSDIATMRSQLAKLLTDTSWRMVFAADEAEFNALWEAMKAQMEGFGYREVVEVDKQNVQELLDVISQVK